MLGQHQREPPSLGRGIDVAAGLVRLRVDVVLLVWFAFTVLSVLYVAYDAFTKNPEMTVMKWDWVLVTLRRLLPGRRSP